MRANGSIAAQCMEYLGSLIQPGITTAELDRQTEIFLKKHGAAASTKGYMGYPASICASVNEMVIHGIPGKLTLKEGDIISIDLVVNRSGYHADMTRTFAVGQISKEAQALVDTAKDCFYEGFKKIVPGARVEDISSAVQRLAESRGYGVIREYCGHGIGREMHESPEVPNYGRAGRGMRLVEGMTLAIEPMITAGSRKVRVLDDGWGVVTQDGSLAAHYENTVAVTASGAVILTEP